MPRRLRTPTPLARKAIEQIVSNCFDGSQVALAKESKLDIAAISRLVNGERPATPEHIGRIVAVVPKSWALKLMKAFLSDVAEASAAGFSVHVSRG